MATEKISLDRTEDYLRAVISYLKSAGRARPKVIFESIAPGLRLSEHERALTRTGAVRWETNARFYVTDAAKAGYIAREDGYWIATPEGEKALALPRGQLIRYAHAQYKAWKSSQAVVVAPQTPTPVVSPVPDDVLERAVVFSEAEEKATTEIEEHIREMDPYDFQELVAELLKAMGYYIRTVAPKGPDGGFDILAYRDPLGVETPHLRVQIRNRQDAVDVEPMRSLHGILKDGVDMGLWVSVGGFTKPALEEARKGRMHIDTIDLPRFITLWREHYAKLSDEGRAMLPLTPIYFLSPDED